MRASHLQTPRQLADCAFTPSADPIERPAYDKQDRVVLRFCFGVVLVLIGMAIGGAL